MSSRDTMIRSGAMIAAICMLGIAAFASIGGMRRNPSDSLDGHPLNDSIPSLIQYYDEALLQARTWHDDAVPIWAEVEILNGRTDVIYRFKSGSFPGERYLVQYEITSAGTEMKIFEGSFQGPDLVDPVIPLDESILDSAEAVDLALSFGAEEFISRYPSARDVRIQLRGTSGAAADELGIEPMRISWRVGISSLPLVSINIHFDPYTGEFLGSIVRE